MRDLILEKLDQIRSLINDATVDGVRVSDTVFVNTELIEKLDSLAASVEYYID